MDANPETKLAFSNLGIDLPVIEWKGRYAAAHYTIEISLSLPDGSTELWEIDNGYAFPNIPTGSFEDYAVGTPFPRSWWDRDPLKSRFVQYEPFAMPGAILR